MSNTVDALKNLYKTLTGQDYSGDPNPTDAEVIDKIAKDATGGGSEGGGESEGSDFEIMLTLVPDGGPTDIITDVTFEEIETAVTAGKNIVISGPDPSDNTKRRAYFPYFPNVDDGGEEVTAISTVFGIYIRNGALNVRFIMFVKTASASPANVSLSFAGIDIND